ncbi:MAG TPA: Arm DNA-binding domain-containing protein, partial [Azonexus sp.]|nr:Arm DNA-binding domain-containing protein [Azonexus sp.]
MKADLNLAFIKSLTLKMKPVGYDSKGKIVFEPNPEGKAYIVYDSSKSAPPGFGIRVAGKKTYIIRRKIHGKSIMPNVGNFADFSEIAVARNKAAELALKIRETGLNPN